MKIAYHGMEGSFSHQTIAPLASSTIGFSNFPEIYQAIEDGKADLGLFPIENSIAGLYYETIDLLMQGNLFIVGELITKIDLNLMGIRGKRLKKVISYPTTLSMCSKFFKKHPDLIFEPFEDTAGAAKYVSEMQDSTIAAIAPREAAETFGLEIFQKNVQDDQQNYTRFFLLSKKLAFGTKSTFIFTIEHQVGELARVLRLFAEHEMDLTAILSRPLREKPFEYLFLVDVRTKKNFEMPDLGVKTLKMLGSYETITNWQNSK